MKALFWVFLTLLLATFYHRVPHYDDAWFAEQAYWLVRDGRVRSELFHGLNGWENQLFVFHKLFICFAAGWQWLFGFSLVASKSIGAVWTLVGGLLVYAYLQKQELDASAGWLGLLIYVGCGTVIEYAFVGRPEPMYAALGFGSFWLLTIKRWRWAGVLAGLAVLTHLNGLCFVLAGIGWLGWQRQWRHLVSFGLVAGAVSSLYLLDVALSQQWAVFWMQLTHDPALGHIDGIWGKLRLLPGFYHHFLVNRTTVLLTALVLGTCLLYIRPLRDMAHPARPVGGYLLLLLGSFALVTRTYASTSYVFTFVPFYCILVSRCVACKRHLNQPGWVKNGFLLLLALYLMAGAAKAVYSIQTNLTTPVLAGRNAQMAALIGHRGATVMAPLNFFYDQVGHYKIRGIDRYLSSFFQYNKEHLTDEQLFQMAGREACAAVITYDGKGPDASLTDTRPLADSLAHLGTYHRVYQDRWNSLYLRD